MTKAKIMREYLKKFYNVDVDGMSLLQVHKDFMKKHFDYDSNATSFISAVRELIDNDLAPGDGGGGGDTDNLVIVKTLPPLAEADPNVTYARPMGNVNMYRFGCQYAAVSEGSLPTDSSELVSAGIEWFIVNNYNGTDETKVFQYMAEGSGEIEETNMTIGSPEDDDTISYDTYHVQAVFCLFYAVDAVGSGENSQYNMDNNFSEEFRGKIYDGYIPYWWES